MAIQDKNGMLRGKAGSVIYRKWRGLNIVQGIPRKFKQTLASQVAAKEFGRASATAANLRKSLVQLYQQCDVGMKNRLTAQVLRALQQSPGKERLERDIHDADLSLLQGFEFNTNSPFAAVMPVQPEVHIAADGRVTIRIPAFKLDDIRYTGEKQGYHDYRLIIMVASYNFREGYADVLKVENLDIALQQPEYVLKVDAVQPSGRIVLVGMALYAVTDWGENIVLHNSPQWSPAAILGMRHVSAGEEQDMDQAERLRYHKAINSRQFLIMAHRCGRNLKDALWLQYKQQLEATRKRQQGQQARFGDFSLIAEGRQQLE